MSVIGDFTISTEAFTLDHALSTVPEMHLEADRLASHSAMEVMPFLWATGGNLDAFHQAINDDPAVESATIAEDTAGERLYRVLWGDAFIDLINEIVDHHAGITRAKAEGQQWSLRLRFAEEEMVSEFQRYFREHGHEFEVQSLSTPKAPRQGEFGLTGGQREALVEAVRSGYFSVPRATSAGELGDRLDISTNATSERLRRGCDTLIRSALMLEDGGK